MRSTRIYLDGPLRAGEQRLLGEAGARHVAAVLRLAPGDALTLFNGDGHDYTARLLRIARGETEVMVGEPGPAEPPSRLSIALGLGIAKGERMDFAIQKAVELGVAAIAPLWTGRSQVKLAGERAERRHRHWLGVVIAACEQSGRKRLPELVAPVALSAWLAAQPDNALRLQLDHRATTGLDAQAPPAQRRVCLLIGPEGGLTPEEKAMATRAGFLPLWLGPRVLRAETAPLAAIAAMQALWGDFRRTGGLDGSSQTDPPLSE